jgi:hypothetical protein
MLSGLLLLAGVAQAVAQSTATGARRTPAITQVDVTISVTPGGAQVTIEKTTLPAPAVFKLAPGNYSVSMAAPGYISQTATIALDAAKGAAQTFAFNLQPVMYRLTVQASVKDAVVTVNKVAKGAQPYAEALTPGTYEVMVSARGYQDFAQTVQLNADTTVAAQLTPSMATLMLSPSYLEGDAQLVKVYLDGKLMNAQQAVRGAIQVPPGRHTVRLASAPSGLAVEGEMDFAPGQSYEMRLLLQFVAR